MERGNDQLENNQHNEQDRQVPQFKDVFVDLIDDSEIAFFFHGAPI
jgi:hypothetical protein